MKRSKSVTAQVRTMYSTNPNLTSDQIVSKLKCKPTQAYGALYLVRKEVNSIPPKRGRPRKVTPTLKPIAVMISDKSITEKLAPDMVNAPPHYRHGGIETIDYIEAKNLNYRLGNVIKYISRAGKKHEMLGLKNRFDYSIMDLEKAKWYLEREIEIVKEARESFINDPRFQ
jgi:hypothetical protein